MLLFFHAGQSEDYFDINSEIHDMILANCGNPILQEVHTKMMARARHGRFMAIMDPDRLSQAVQEHEALMLALRNRDADSARLIWRDHLLHTGQSVTDVLRNQDLS